MLGAGSVLVARGVCGGPVAGGGVLAEEGIKVGADAELVGAARHPRRFQVFGPGGNLLVCGQRRIRGQPEPADRRRSRVLAPQLHPRIALGLFPPFLRPGRIGFQDGAGDQGPDLPRSLPRHPTGEHRRFGLSGSGIVQDPGGLRDHLGLVGVDHAFTQRPVSRRQAGSEVTGQGGRPFGCPPRNTECDRNLIGAELSP